MDKFRFKRLKSRISIGSKSRFTIIFTLKTLFIASLSLLAISATIYFGVYAGYQTKLISEIDEIPVEYKNVSIILDSYSDNDYLLLGFLDRAYDKRKFTDARIYSLSEKNKESIAAMIRKFPANRITIDFTKNTLPDICQSIKEELIDQKSMILANPDIAVRAVNICNSEGILTIPLTIEEPESLIYSISFQTRVEELFETLF